MEYLQLICNALLACIGLGPLQGSTDIHRISLTHVAARAGALVNWFVGLSVLSFRGLVFYVSFVAVGVSAC